jgi:hypothetical protein
LRNKRWAKKIKQRSDKLNLIKEGILDAQKLSFQDEEEGGVAQPVDAEEGFLKEKDEQAEEGRETGGNDQLEKFAEVNFKVSYSIASTA